MPGSTRTTAAGNQVKGAAKEGVRDPIQEQEQDPIIELFKKRHDPYIYKVLTHRN